MRKSGGDAVLDRNVMVARLEKDADLAHVKTMLEEFYETHPHIAYILCAKFWCDLPWIQWYWNDAKRTTRELYDYTITGLKK